MKISETACLELTRGWLGNEKKLTDILKVIFCNYFMEPLVPPTWAMTGIEVLLVKVFHSFAF
jgi:hypothetical protein